MTGQDVANGTIPAPAVGPADATATGDGLLVVAQYDANPGGTPSFTANGTYFDVYAAAGQHLHARCSIAACSLTANDKLFWWDAAAQKWQKASPQCYDQATAVSP